MAQPTPYSPSTDFTELPDDQIKTKLDIEFTNLNTTLDETLANLALIQRDDGALRNQIVTPDTLSQATLNLMGEWNNRGAWVTLTVYSVGDLVAASGGTYVCAVAHTAGTFGTDFAAGKWIIIASTASSTAESFVVTGSTPPANGIYLPAANTVGIAGQGLDVMRFVSVNSAVNYFTTTNSATGNALSIAATGTDTNIGITVTPKGNGKFSVPGVQVTASTSSPLNGMELLVGEVLQFNANSQLAFHLWGPSSSVNRFQMKAARTAFYPVLQVGGSDTNIGMVLQSKGAVGIVFNTGGDGTGNSLAAGVTQMVVEHTASSVNWWSMQGAAAAGEIRATAQGSDTNIGMGFRAKGSGSHKFYTNAGGQLQFEVGHIASAVNWARIQGGSSGVNPKIVLDGSNTNVSLEIVGKGTGGLRIGAQEYTGFDSPPTNQVMLKLGPVTNTDPAGGISAAPICLQIVMHTPGGLGSVIGADGISITGQTLDGFCSDTNTRRIVVGGWSASNGASISNAYGVWIDNCIADGSLTSVTNPIALRVEALQVQNACQVTNVETLFLVPSTVTGASSLITNSKLISISSPTTSSSGAITNHAAIYIANQGTSGITNSYAIQIAAQSAATTPRVLDYNSGAMYIDANGFVKDAGDSICTSAFSATSGGTGTTLTNITGMTATVIAAGKYRFRAVLTVTSTVNSGIKVAIGGTATATAFQATAWNYNATTLNAVTSTTTKGNAIGAATAVATDVIIEGYIEVANAGTITAQAAQNASHADATTVVVGSSLKVWRI